MAAPLAAARAAELLSTGATSFPKSFCTPDKSALCQLPGRRSRAPHASCSPAVSRSTRLRRRIPGSLGRYLAAPRPPLSRRGAAVLRLPPLTRTHLPSRISLPSPTRPPLEGTLRGEAVRSRRVGRSHSGCGSSSSSSGGPPHPAPAPEPPRRGARPSTYSPLPRRHRCTSRPGGREGCWGVEWRRPGRVWRACAP